MLPGRTAWILAAVWAAALASPAQAYIGPGAGISAVGALVGLVATVVMVLGALVLWPLRRVLRRGARKTRGPETAAGPDETDGGRA